jgi:hypothetical protein
MKRDVMKHDVLKAMFGFLIGSSENFHYWELGSGGLKDFLYAYLRAHTEHTHTHTHTIHTYISLQISEKLFHFVCRLPQKSFQPRPLGWLVVLLFGPWVHLYIVCIVKKYIMVGGGRFSAPVDTGPGTHPAPAPASYTMIPGSFPGVKRPRHRVDHPPHLTPGLKKTSFSFCGGTIGIFHNLLGIA